MRRTIILVSSVLVMGTADGLAQSSEQDPTIRELRNQLEGMRVQLATMQNRLATLEAKAIPDTSSSTEPTPPLPPETIRSQPDETKTAGEPTALHFKGLTLSPGGFLDSTALVRTRNENADMATSYSAVPLNGSSNANLSELRGTARNFAAVTVDPDCFRAHNITGIYRSRLPRSIPNRELRPIQFLDSTLEASLDASRVAVGMDGHSRSDVVAADLAPTRRGQSRGTETARSRCQPCGGVRLDQLRKPGPVRASRPVERNR